jgi:hypothetical protein
MPYTPDLDRLLCAGSEYVDDPDTYRIERHQVTEVVLSSGHVVGCDPLVSATDTEPFTVTVTPGRYPLVAWVAVLLTDAAERDRRVAALQLVIRDEPVAEWTMALPAGNDLSSLGEDEFFGYPVDAGVGTLADVDALDALALWDDDETEDVFIPVDAPLAPVPGLVDAVTDDETGANVAIVYSGWGDGCYPTFVGYTASGEVAAFVTDFMVVPD